MIYTTTKVVLQFELTTFTIIENLHFVRRNSIPRNMRVVGIAANWRRTAGQQPGFSYRIREKRTVIRADNEQALKIRLVRKQITRRYELELTL